VTAFPSRYEFLKAHNGIRPNCLHGIMGSSGSGKSTIFKCIIAEAAQHAPVLVWLSEESVVEYQELINYMDDGCLHNIKFVEEKDIPEERKLSQNDFLETFEQAVEASGAELVFIDNVTSSAFYNTRYGFAGQNKTASFLQAFVKRKCAIFYVTHTDASVSDNHAKIINQENIRGSKELPIVTEYLYIIQKMTNEDRQYNLVRTAKYRHHEKAKGWYALNFSDHTYIGDKKVPFSMVNAIFKSRDYLGKKGPKAKAKTD